MNEDVQEYKMSKREFNKALKFLAREDKKNKKFIETFAIPLTRVVFTGSLPKTPRRKRSNHPLTGSEKQKLHREKRRANGFMKKSFWVQDIRDNPDQTFIPVKIPKQCRGLYTKNATAAAYLNDVFNVLSNENFYGKYKDCKEIKFFDQALSNFIRELQK